MSDVETGEHHPTARISLLSSTSINVDDEEDICMTTSDTRTRSTSIVSRVTLPDNTTGTLSFHQINYIIGDESLPKRPKINYTPLNCFKTTKRKQILSNVSGQFRCGMNAILGKFLGILKK